MCVCVYVCVCVCVCSPSLSLPLSSALSIHNNIVYEVNEGMQGVLWKTSKEYITIKWAIQYAITWAHKAWVKLMQLDTRSISATWSLVLCGQITIILQGVVAGSIRAVTGAYTASYNAL